VKKASLIHDSTEKNPDLYYVTKFKAPDPFIFLEVRGRKTMVMNDLEIDRAKKQADVNEVLSLNEFMDAAKKKHKDPSSVDVIIEILRKKKIKQLVMPADSSFALVDGLRKKGIKVTSGGSPFYPKRLVKTPEEVRAIREAQRVVFGAMRMVEETLRTSRVRGGKLFYRGKVLTSDYMRTLINMYLMERGFVASDTIVACGNHSIDPHDVGSGPLKAGQSIIVDIFPKSLKTLYYGDATRTFCKGRAPEVLRKLYAAVKHAQKMGVNSIKAGADGKKIHQSILNYFEKKGYPTGEKSGRMQGFFHSTGHGIGLEIHEKVRINPMGEPLKPGHVVSVEPGLYYKGIGGVRLEDLVHVKRGGREVLSGYPKRLEIK
jgi:Xaa-Pro aminopeptidase